MVPVDLFHAMEVQKTKLLTDKEIITGKIGLLGGL
jgi:hypothetical protein